MQRKLTVFFLLILSLLILFNPIRALAEQPNSSLQEVYAAAAKEFKIPENILLALSYNLSRWEDHNGKPSFAGGYGPMHLTDVDMTSFKHARGEEKKDLQKKSADPMLHTLDSAAKKLNISPQTLKDDPRQNIRGGAALLAEYANQTLGKQPTNEADWYAAVAKYSGSQDENVASEFANIVYETIKKGEAHTTTEGKQVTLQATAITPNKETLKSLSLKKFFQTDAECPISLACKWAPAAYQQNDPNDSFNYGNYEKANREQDGLDIKYIVIHDTEGPYAATINFFQDPTSFVSSHYVIRSSDGEITQMVKNKDVALHAGNWYINMHSIGIEHEGFAIEGAQWYTEFMYKSSAKLTQWLAHKYSIPIDRAHIIGHDDYSAPTADLQAGMHWDPGPYWNWAHYMELMGVPQFSSIPTRTNKVKGVVTINPKFESNFQKVTTCDDAQTEVTQQPTNFVSLYTAPSFDAPFVDDQTLPGPGTTKACDWGDKAAFGQQFYRVERQGDWDAIYYGGQKAWFYNPQKNPTASPTIKKPLLVTPKSGQTSIPVYGRAYPETSAYPYPDAIQSITPLQYTIPVGQMYVATDKVEGDYYKSWFFGYTPNTTDDYLVKGNDEYYTIFFNHRFAFVKATDVDTLQ